MSSSFKSHHEQQQHPIHYWIGSAKAAKLYPWNLAEAVLFYFIKLFIFHDNSIIYMVDCVKSVGERASCEAHFLNH